MRTLLRLISAAAAFACGLPFAGCRLGFDYSQRQDPTVGSVQAGSGNVLDPGDGDGPLGVAGAFETGDGDQTSGDGGANSGGSRGGADASGGGSSTGGGDAGPQILSACDSYGPFAAPELVSGLGFSDGLYGASLSPYGDTLFYAVQSGGIEDIYQSFRSDRGTVFSAGVAVSELNTSSNEGSPRLSEDGLQLYFFSDRPGTLGSRDLMRATRPTLDALFDPPGWLSDINSPDADHLPFPTADGLELFFSTTRVGGVTGSDIYVATRASDQDEFGSPQSLSEINTSFREASPSLSHDGLTLFFSSDRGGASGNDIWLAERSSRDEPFGSPVAMDVVNAPSSELDPYLSIDGRELFFSSSRSGTTELWRSIRDCQ